MERLLQHRRGLPEAAILNRRPLRVDVFRDRPGWTGGVSHHNAPTRLSLRASTGHMLLARMNVPSAKASAEASLLVAYIFRYHVSLEQIYAGRRFTGST